MATIKGFLEQIQKIAQEKSEDYCRVNVELYSNGKTTYQSYINGLGLTEGGTVRECVKNTREKAFPKPKKIPNIQI